MKVIDADGHIEESEVMFERLEREYYDRRPLAVGLAKDSVYGPMNATWLIDGEIYPKLVGRGQTFFGNPTIAEFATRKAASVPAQEMTDMAARLRDLDEMGIDTQVVFPTMFLGTTTEDVKFEAALMRAYNDFVADACSNSGGRVRFAAIVPIRDVEESVAELRRAKGLGAVAIMLHGVAWDRPLADKSLWPFYEEAANLDVPVLAHFGWGCPAITNAFFSGETFTRGAGSFHSSILTVLMGFHSVMASGLMEVFPRLRFGFLEVGSHWVPYLIHQLRRSGRAKKDPADYFRAGRAYVACEADEDINYIVEWVGEDGLVVASDYPHTDPSTEEAMVGAIMEREDVPLRVREKVLSDNPARLYGL